MSLEASCRFCGQPTLSDGLPSCGTTDRVRSLSCLRIENLNARVIELDTLLRDRPKFEDAPIRFLEWDERVRHSRQAHQPLPVRPQ